MCKDGKRRATFKALLLTSSYSTDSAKGNFEMSFVQTCENDSLSHLSHQSFHLCSSVAPALMIVYQELYAQLEVPCAREPKVQFTEKPVSFAPFYFGKRLRSRILSRLECQSSASAAVNVA